MDARQNVYVQKRSASVPCPAIKLFFLITCIIRRAFIDFVVGIVIAIANVHYNRTRKAKRLKSIFEQKMRLVVRVLIPSINYSAPKTNKSFYHDYKQSNMHIFPVAQKVTDKRTYGLHERHLHLVFASSKRSSRW